MEAAAASAARLLGGAHFVEAAGGGFGVADGGERGAGAGLVIGADDGVAAGGFQVVRAEGNGVDGALDDAGHDSGGGTKDGFGGGLRKIGHIGEGGVVIIGTPAGQRGKVMRTRP